MSANFQRVEDGLYMRDGLYYARVRDEGRRTWRGTGTDNLTKARTVLTKWREEQVLKRHGIETPKAALKRNRLTVGEVLDAYVEAGYPTKKMHGKSPVTIANELKALRPVRVYFGDRVAVTLTLADADKYCDWRNTHGYVVTRTDKAGQEVKKRTKGGKRSVDLELTALSNALGLAVRRGDLKQNPLKGRTAYSVAADVRHCREVAPTPEGLSKIETWLRQKNEQAVADLVVFLACSGLRLGEALVLDWESVDWQQGVIHVEREKRGCNPFVPLFPELAGLLQNMKARAPGYLLFPSPFNPDTPRDQSAVRHRITAACKAQDLPHVTPHGLRSYFVTQARQSGLTDAEIAMLIGDKTGPAIIAAVYGDVRPDHLLKQAHRIQLRASAGDLRNIPVCIPALSEGDTSWQKVRSVGKVA
jgi:integrase